MCGCYQYYFQQQIKAINATNKIVAPTCVTWPTAALISGDDVITSSAIDTGTGNTFIHVRLAQPARISGRACAQEASSGDRQRVARGGVPARRPQAAVHLVGTPTSGVSHGAGAAEGVDEVDTGAAVCAR